MSTSPPYSLQLASSANMTPLEPLDAAKSRRLQVVFDKPGTLSLQLPIDSRAASLLRLRSTCAIVYRRALPIWSGACTNIVDAAAAGTTSVTFTGWLEQLDKRFIRASEVPGLVFVNVVGGTIVSTLLSTVNAQTDSTGVVRPSQITIGAVTDTQTRTRTYKVGDSYGQAIRELVEIENGLDLYVDPLTRKLSTRAPTSYVDRKNVRFGYLVDPGNLDDVSVTSDGLALANRENVVAAGGITYSVDDQAAIAAASVMLEKQTSLSDVQNGTVAAAYAAAELAYEKFGVTTYSLTVKQYGDMPRPWDDFELGDKIYFSANRGRIQADNQAVRVFSLSIDIDDNGNEIISELGVAQ